MTTVNDHPCNLKQHLTKVETVKAELKETREEAKVKKAVELEHIAIEFDHENSENLLLGSGPVIREEEKEVGGGNVKEDLMREIEVYQEKLAENEQLAEQLRKVIVNESSTLGHWC